MNGCLGGETAAEIKQSVRNGAAVTEQTTEESASVLPTPALACCSMHVSLRVLVLNDSTKAEQLGLNGRVVRFQFSPITGPSVGNVIVL